MFPLIYFGNDLILAVSKFTTHLLFFWKKCWHFYNHMVSCEWNTLYLCKNVTSFENMAKMLEIWHQK